MKRGYYEYRVVYAKPGISAASLEHQRERYFDTLEDAKDYVRLFTKWFNVDSKTGKSFKLKILKRKIGEWEKVKL